MPNFACNESQLPSIREAAEQERRLRRRIERALAAGERKRARYFTGLYLKSGSAKLVATIEANKKLKPHRKVKNELVLEIAASLDPWKGTDESVSVNAVANHSNPNDQRIIFDFGIQNRALQILVREALRPWAQLHPDQFAIQGGRQEAGKAVVNALGDGFRWAVQTDIKDCFSTFDDGEVARLLPIPEEVTRKVITTQHLNITSGNIIELLGMTEIAVEVRQGIPQGSAVSSLVAEMLLAPVAFGLPGDVRPVFYSDNILVITRQKSEAVTIAKTLKSALMSHPAGPLWPKFIEIKDARMGFDFLGYRFSKEADTVRVEPATFNLNKFNQQQFSYLKRLTQGEDAVADKERIRRKARRYVRSWCQAFSLWPDWSVFRTKKLTEIQSAAVE